MSKSHSKVAIVTRASKGIRPEIAKILASAAAAVGVEIIHDADAATRSLQRSFVQVWHKWQGP